MAITDTQKIDLLFKKVGFGVSKTDTADRKSPANESNASPLLLRGENIYVQSNDIPAVPPADDTSIITVYKAGATNPPAQATVDNTSSANRTWKTGLLDWIGPEFGPQYSIKVYMGPSGSTDPVADGYTVLPPDGVAGRGDWYFDYQSGILNFIGEILPNNINGQAIYIQGYRYTGPKGLVGGLSLSDLADVEQATPTIDSTLVYDGTTFRFSNPVAAIGDLTDVDITGIQDNQLLVYNAQAGVFEAGGSPVSRISDLSDVSDRLPNFGDVLTWDGVSFTPLQPGSGTSLEIEDLANVTTNDLQVDDILAWNGSAFVNISQSDAAAMLSTVAIRTGGRDALIPSDFNTVDFINKDGIITAPLPTNEQDEIDFDEINPTTGFIPARQPDSTEGILFNIGFEELDIPFRDFRTPFVKKDGTEAELNVVNKITTDALMANINRPQTFDFGDF